MSADGRQPVWIALAAIGLVTGALSQTTFAIDNVQVAIPGATGQQPEDLGELRVWRDWLLDNGFIVDRCGHDPATGTMTVDEVSQSGLLDLEDAGFTIISTTVAGGGNAAPPDPAYYDPAEIDQALEEVANAYGDIVSRFAIGTTWEGRPIHAIEISNHPGAVEDKPAIQFNGQHHAREVVTSHIVMDVVQTLTQGYGVDEDITRWVDSYKTVCVPMVNPDGVQHVFDQYSMWRRNRRAYEHCLGVDLNRNYPYLWGPGCGSSGDCNDIFRGPSAASEIETQAMMALADRYRFVMATSYHSYGRFIDYPYACSTGVAGSLMPEHLVIEELMWGVADAIERVDGVAYQVYCPVPFGGVNGDDTSWYYAHRGTYALIIEAGLRFAPPFADAEGIVRRNRGGWRYLYERLGQARIDVRVLDACDRKPLEATVTLADFSYDHGELRRWTRPPFGRWTYLVVGNHEYTVRAARGGYQTQEVTVEVGEKPVPIDILLEPAEACTDVAGGIPTVSEWGLCAIALLLLCAGSILAGRRRAA